MMCARPANDDSDAIAQCLRQADQELQDHRAAAAAIEKWRDRLVRLVLDNPAGYRLLPFANL